MRHPALLAAALLVAGFAAVPACAQHAADAFIAAWDGNCDGGISKDEYVGEYAARLDKQLAASSRTEEARREERTRQIRQTHVRFGVLDTDKDGVITAADAAHHKAH
ncbi:hypothetical protein [Sphingomonas sp. LM7]|uniref:hypothetical protein n=1 Tax=Sphingomonas sp. LM7 TaxID=1938607 RepID=UPI000983C7D6|nr:hypothetical protein [Sphingomonas sp. LM7]AQR74322.1 hypothetical protein BXU08_12275 [Sphingomonas sp. LM7]